MTLQVVTAKGSFYDVGRAVGVATRKQVRLLLRKTLRSKSKAVKYFINYKLYGPYFSQNPDALAYLQGMADAVGVDVLRLIKLNITELDRKVSRLKQVEPEQCSAFIINDGEKVMIGHNEDSININDGVFLLDATFSSGVKLLTICYYGSLPGFSFTANSHGLVLFNNSLSANDAGIGVPKRLLLFELAFCETIDAALEKINGSERSSGQNYILYSRGNVMNVEVSATDLALTPVVDRYFHCNNYINPTMLQYEGKKPAPRATFIRSRSAFLQLPKLNNLEDIETVLSSHQNRPSCFCCHGDLGDFNNTIASIFFDSSEKKVKIGYGKTCEKDFIAVDLPYT